MMEQLKIIQNIQHRCKALKKYFKKAVPNFDADALHHFRTTYKKLRAFLRLLSQGTTKPIKIPKKLKRIYRQAGNIRSIQLQQKQISTTTKRHLNTTLGYCKLLEKRMRRPKHALTDMHAKTIFSQSKKKLNNQIKASFSESNLIDFAHLKWEAIHSIVQLNDIVDSDLHNIRKQLKDLFYNRKHYKAANQNILAASIWKDKRQLFYHQLLDELGKFQDKRVSIDLINDANIKRLSQAEKNKLANIKQGWENEKAIKKSTLINKLKTDLNLNDEDKLQIVKVNG